MNRLVHYGAVLLIIAGLSAGLLSTVNGMTKPQIEKINKKIVNDARVSVLPEASTFKVEEAVTAGEEKFIPGYDTNGNLVGYAATVKTNGYSGVITFVLGLDTKGTITGLKVTGQSETPGLGTNIEKSEWQKQWIGRDKNYQFTKMKDGKFVDAFAGATITPKAVYTGVMKATKAFEEVSK
jgi:electron transport complex protein RnfG